MKSLEVTLIVLLSFVKNKVANNTIIMKIDRENNGVIFFRPYMKLSRMRYVTNDISLRK